jgi:hypothetical protein
MKMSDELNKGEAHPSSSSALAYIGSLGMQKLFEYQEAFATTAIEGNRLSEICLGTLHRLLNKEPVSDRYLLGLAWIIRNMEENNE